MLKPNSRRRTVDDEDLIDFYAGLAMMALISKSDGDAPIEDIADHAYDIALAMVNEKFKRQGYDD